MFFLDMVGLFAYLLTLLFSLLALQYNVTPQLLLLEMFMCCGKCSLITPMAIATNVIYFYIFIIIYFLIIFLPYFEDMKSEPQDIFVKPKYATRTLFLINTKYFQ